MAKQWTLFVDEDKDPHIIISENGHDRLPTKDECERAISILNEEGSNIVRLSCRTEGCTGKGGWIERTRLDASKNIYLCEGGCGRPMER
jgi:hypothetical protein